jgi:predicted component of type VI protein secretion system
MNVKLLVEKSDSQPAHAIAIAAEETVVGRHRDCGLRIPVAEVSRRHCILRLDSSGLRLEDLGSLNGTYVNGERVQGTQELHAGDRVEIGPVVYSVVYEGMEVVAVAALPAEATVEAIAADVATVDIKPSDTSFIEPPAEGAVVTVEQVAEEPPARPEALTRLER